MIIRSNNIMEEYLRTLNYDFRTTPYELPEAIASVLDKGFSQHDNTILLTALNEQTTLPVFNDDQERMDFEYTNNKFTTDSPEEDDELDYLRRTLECANRIANKLKEEFPGKIFKVLVFFNETNFESDHMALFASSSVRFYEVKQPDGENDLESYEGEAVLEIEVQ
ncbi:hypothetical protein MKQ68_05465 [Chitinophaga horti]|uniref:Uncharacterized protein n=1 Tax=Chitinophaga horti TaxID=2920382 RepID=A0ABY6J4D8_9BACT|nr:hypothetical protein [Chitinophaga horti]UYQ94538.1 hypothetical protein MKQ68_05465 [Chitinophaga horti]